MMLSVCATLVAVVLTAFITSLRWWSSYWSRRNVPTVSENILYGVIRKTFCLEETIGDSYKRAYDIHKDKRYFGTFVFGKPTLVVTDPEIIKHILVKDFVNFNSHAYYVDPKKDPLSAHLFNLEGEKWRAMRSKLSGTFTAGKVKNMFDTVQSRIDRFFEIIDKELKETGNVVDIRDKLACLSTDIIALVAFGVEANTLENPKAEFREAGRLIFTPGFKELMRIFVLINAHWLAKLLRIRTTGFRPYKFIMEMVKNTVEYREKHNANRNDLLDLLIQLKNKGYIDGEGKNMDDAVTKNNAADLKRMTLNEVAAQVYVFYIAGFETTSTLTAFALHKLSVHKEIQKKVQEECDRVLQANGSKVTYECIQSMQYTDKVLHETLRFYPPVGVILRATLKKCKLPTTDIGLEKGTNIVLPVFGLQRDPEYFPDPEKFDPDRFSDERKTSIVPYTYMPFGEGPRLCIGMKLGLLQAKSTLLGLLSRYNLDITKDTPNPLKLDPRALFTAPTKLDIVLTERECVKV